MVGETDFFDAVRRLSGYRIFALLWGERLHLSAEIV